MATLYGIVRDPAQYGAGVLNGLPFCRRALWHRQNYSRWRHHPRCERRVASSLERATGAERVQLVLGRPQYIYQKARPFEAIGEVRDGAHRLIRESYAKSPPLPPKRVYTREQLLVLRPASPASPRPPSPFSTPTRSSTPPNGACSPRLRTSPRRTPSRPPRARWAKRSSSAPSTTLAGCARILATPFGAGARTSRASRCSGIGTRGRRRGTLPM